VNQEEGVELRELRNRLYSPLGEYGFVRERRGRRNKLWGRVGLIREEEFCVGWWVDEAGLEGEGVGNMTVDLIGHRFCCYFEKTGY
jgi:hypothetical protein